MTWATHQARGFFGFNTTGRIEREGNREVVKWDHQPRWTGSKTDPNWAVVDIGEAIAESEGLRDLFWRWMRWPDSPPFAGGVLTDWPARDADALAFARAEWRAVQTYLRSLEVPRG